MVEIHLHQDFCVEELEKHDRVNSAVKELRHHLSAPCTSLKIECLFASLIQSQRGDQNQGGRVEFFALYDIPRLTMLDLASLLQNNRGSRFNQGTLIVLTGVHYAL